MKKDEIKIIQIAFDIDGYLHALSEDGRIFRYCKRKSDLSNEYNSVYEWVWEEFEFNKVILKNYGQQ